MVQSSERRGLSGLVQLRIESELQPSVSYRIERRIGEGALGLAFLALRDAPDGSSPVVIKVIKPQIVAGMGATASLVVQKEAVALGRLNESVPPTPFVVRLIDTGSAPLYGSAHPSLPWIAIEYVHGGVEGTTLEERVAHSRDKTGFAFDAARAGHLVRCLGHGLTAIHAVGVIHRDLNPNNVLCCGFGEAEIFKISDFGIARPGGMKMTFGEAQLGTIGYAAPEQGHKEGPGVDTYTDVFSFGCVVFHALTGENYFDAMNPVRALVAMQSPSRRSIRSSQWLYPELRERADACDAIDQALARATSFNPQDRPPRAEQLAQLLLPWLATSEQPPKPSRRRVNSLLGLSSPAQVSSFNWTVRHPPGAERVIRSAAWEADGSCLAVTTRGLDFWDGTKWSPTNTAALELPYLLFARRFAPGRYLIGGGDGLLAVLAGQGIRDSVHAPDLSVAFCDASGRFDDLLVAVGVRPNAPPELWAMAARRWMRPLPLGGVAFVSSLLRIDDSRWLVAGRLDDGGAFVALYTPMLWEATMVLRESARAFVAGASQPERGLVLIVGTDGVAVRFEGDRSTPSIVEGRPDLTAAAIDVLDREWVAGAGSLWFRDPERDPRWQSVWRDPRFTVPVVGLMADAGLVLAMTADGAIVEGRAPWRT